MVTLSWQIELITWLNIYFDVPCVRHHYWLAMSPLTKGSKWHIYLLVNYAIIASDNGLLCRHHYWLARSPLTKGTKWHIYLLVNYAIIASDNGLLCRHHYWLARSPLTKGSKWHIYLLVNYAIIASDNGLSPFQCIAIIWLYTVFLSIGYHGRNFSESDPDDVPFHTAVTMIIHFIWQSTWWCSI